MLEIKIILVTNSRKQIVHFSFYFRFKIVRFFCRTCRGENLKGKVEGQLPHVRVTVVRFQVYTKYLSLLQSEQTEYGGHSYLI